MEILAFKVGKINKRVEKNEEEEDEESRYSLDFYIDLKVEDKKIVKAIEHVRW